MTDLARAWFREDEPITPWGTKSKDVPDQTWCPLRTAEDYIKCFGVSGSTASRSATLWGDARHQRMAVSPGARPSAGGSEGVPPW